MVLGEGRMLKGILFATALLLSLVGTWIEPATAVYPSLPLLKIEPERIACHKYSESFSISVWLMEEGHGPVDSFWDIEGFDVCLNFNASFMIAAKADIDPDGWWNSFWPGGTFEVRREIDNTAGTVNVAFLGLLDENQFHQPPNGIGRIFNVSFQTIATTITPQTGVEITLRNNILDVVGFPHPERPYPPWNSEEVRIPHIVENATLYINPAGDINFDGEVDIHDVVAMSSIYGCKEGEPNWNPNADLSPPYGKIDILDLVTCVYHYGEKYP
jgi:hypothetical protein